MVYRRKSYRPKKSYRKKKIFKKRRMMRKTVKSTGHAVICNFTKEMTHGTYTSETALQDRMRVHWGKIDLGSVNNEVSLDNSAEWQFWAAVYTKYKVTGVKMTWKPDAIYGGGTSVLYKDMHVASLETAEVTLNGTTLPFLQQKPDYKAGDLSRPFTKYVSVSKYIKRLNGVMVPNIDANFTVASTQFMGRSQVANNAVTGAMHVAWYVKFYGPRGAF